MTFKNDKFILNEAGDPVPEHDLQKWARWFQNAKERIVKQERIGETKVSTVFLGLDHSFGDAEAPILWETMCFGGKLDQEMDRCGGNREQAEAMHARMAHKVKTT